jgi:hypothetical protein
MASEKSRGPKGSPCRTPVADWRSVLAEDEVGGGVVGPLGRPVKRGAVLPKAGCNVASVCGIEGIGEVEHGEGRKRAAQGIVQCPLYGPNHRLNSSLGPDAELGR